MKRLLGYVRVSTTKQGEHGVSLHEQRDAISRHAAHLGIEVTRWFEERQTAAKRGRPVFSQMLRLLKRGDADGVIIHKIDRSARNLKDWSDLGELIDAGIEVHFANESIDLHSRGGRLSADIQAVVAADYVRNLREETRKGFYGRLKQGFYPLPAPLGYVDRGKAKPKEIDVTTAPLVRRAFELYATGRYTLVTLRAELRRRGLRNRRGKAVSLNGISRLLNNPFYIGLIRLQSTGERFRGVHTPLITKSLFDRVQAVLTGRTNTRAMRHDMTFRRILRCGRCAYALVGEVQKKHVYYRCHSPGCAGTSMREERIDDAITEALAPLGFSPEEQSYLGEKLPILRASWAGRRVAQRDALLLRRKSLEERLNRLTDAYIDQLIDRDAFEQRKEALLLERAETEDQIRQLEADETESVDRLEQFLELAGTASRLYKSALGHEKRELLKSITSNLCVDGKTLVIVYRLPFQTIANRFQTLNGDPYRDVPRTVDALIQGLSEVIVTKNLEFVQNRQKKDITDAAISA